MKIRATRTVIAVSLLATLCGAATSASAGHVIYGVKASTTSTLMHGGNRERTRLGFHGTADTMQGSDFLNFRDGSLTSNAETWWRWAPGSFAWSPARAPRCSWRRGRA